MTVKVRVRFRVRVRVRVRVSASPLIHTRLRTRRPLDLREEI